MYFLNFNETLVAKMSKEPQPPLGGMFVNEHFGHLAYIEDQIEEDIDVLEESQAQKIPISMKNLSCMILLILVSCLEKKINLTTF